MEENIFKSSTNTGKSPGVHSAVNSLSGPEPQSELGWAT